MLLVFRVLGDLIKQRFYHELDLINKGEITCGHVGIADDVTYSSLHLIF